MNSLVSLKKLTIISIVDNEASDGSSPCSCMKPVRGLSRERQPFDPRICTYTTETATILERQAELNIGNLCHAAHGFSILLIAEYDSENVDSSVVEDNKQSTITRRRCLLFDTGPNPTLWKQNAERLHLPLHEIDAITLSHYHVDHSGGLIAAIPEISRARLESSPPVIIDLHPDHVSSRGMKVRGKIYPMEPDNLSPYEMAELKIRDNVSINLSKVGHTICDGCFYISGEIPRVTTFETGLSGHFRRLKNGNWVPDPDIMEERYVACQIRGRGIIIVSACSHSGIINVCNDAINKIGCAQIAGVVGGFHLSGSESVEERIDETIKELKSLQPAVVLAGHCTGWRAKAKLAVAFSSNFQPLSVGGKYIFQGQ